MDSVRVAHERVSTTEREQVASEAGPRGQAAQSGSAWSETQTLSKVLAECPLILGAAAWAWLIGGPAHRFGPDAVSFAATALGVRLVIYILLGLYRRPWRTVSNEDVLWLAGSALLGAPVMAGLLLGWPGGFKGQSAALLPVLEAEPALYLVLAGMSRIVVRTLGRRAHSGPNDLRVLVVGSGDAARALVWQTQNVRTGYRVVGLVDDDPQQRGNRVLGVPVLGCCREIGQLAVRLQVQKIVVAIPSLSAERLREILADCKAAHVPVRLLPRLRELMHNPVGVSALREVRPEDLLPRPEVKIDETAVAGYLRDQTVLVTGGGGSIGSELCRQALQFGVRRLLVLGRGENSVFEVHQELLARGPECEVVPVICDVQDRRALRRVFEHYQPDVVFHAAAHKHVPLMEQHPAEAVKNNIVGTLNVVRLAAEQRVRRFVLVSTDKAVNPTSVMGSTKRVAEKIVKGFAETHDLNMVSVRFGNVLGSRGSVVPTMSPADPHRSAGDGDRPGNGALFHDDPGGRAPDLASRRDGGTGGRVRAGHGASGPHPRPGDRSHPAVRPGPPPRRADPHRGTAARGEAEGRFAAPNGGHRRAQERPVLHCPDRDGGVRGHAAARAAPANCGGNRALRASGVLAEGSHPLLLAGCGA